MKQNKILFLNYNPVISLPEESGCTLVYLAELGRRLGQGQCRTCDIAMSHWLGRGLLRYIRLLQISRDWVWISTTQRSMSYQTGGPGHMTVYCYYLTACCYVTYFLI